MPIRPIIPAKKKTLETVTNKETMKAKPEVITADEVITVKSNFPSSTKGKKGENVSTEISVRKFLTEPAKVSVGANLKKADDAYGNSGVFVSVTVPCYAEELDAAYEYASKKADEYVTRELKQAGIVDDAPKAKAGKKATKAAEPEEDFEDAEEETEEKEIELTVDQIKTMKKSELVELINSSDLDIDVKKITDVAELRSAVLEALGAGDDDDSTEDADDSDDDAEEEEDDSEADEDSDDEAEEAASDEPYTHDELAAASFADLKGLATTMKLKVKVDPEASPVKKKAAYIKAILKAQEESEE